MFFVVLSRPGDTPGERHRARSTENMNKEQSGLRSQDRSIDRNLTNKTILDQNQKSVREDNEPLVENDGEW